MNNWNGLDFFIFLIFVLNTLIGMNRGAAKEIISMMCLSIGLIFAVKFTVPLANFFNSSPIMNSVVDNSVMQNFMLAIGAGPLTVGLLKELFYSISLLICFMFAFSITEGALAYSGFTETYSFPYATLSRKVGAALGCVRGYVFTLILLVILTLHIYKNDSLPGQGAFQGSFFVELFRGATQRMDNIIAGQKPETYKEILKDKDLYKVEDIYKVIKNDGMVEKFDPTQKDKGKDNKPVNTTPNNEKPNDQPSNNSDQLVNPPSGDKSGKFNITY